MHQNQNQDQYVDSPSNFLSRNKNKKMINMDSTRPINHWEQRLQKATNIGGSTYLVLLFVCALGILNVPVLAQLFHMSAPAFEIIVRHLFMVSLSIGCLSASIVVYKHLKKSFSKRGAIETTSTNKNIHPILSEILFFIAMSIPLFGMNYAGIALIASNTSLMIGSVLMNPVMIAGIKAVLIAGWLQLLSLVNIKLYHSTPSLPEHTKKSTYPSLQNVAKAHSPRKHPLGFNTYTTQTTKQQQEDFMTLMNSTDIGYDGSENTHNTFRG